MNVAWAKASKQKRTGRRPIGHAPILHSKRSSWVVTVDRTTIRATYLQGPLWQRPRGLNGMELNELSSFVKDYYLQCGGAGLQTGAARSNIAESELAAKKRWIAAERLQSWMQ